MTINIVNKRVVMPDMKVLKYETNSNTLNFETDRYFDSVDLGDCNVYIKTLRQDGFSDKLLLATAITDNKILFDWTLGANDTMVEGDLQCQISFEKANEFVLNTQVFSIEVMESLSGYESTENGYVESIPFFSDIVYNKELETEIEGIKAKIPQAATTENMLVDKLYLDSKLSSSNKSLIEISGTMQVQTAYIRANDGVASGDRYFEMVQDDAYNITYNYYPGEAGLVMGESSIRGLYERITASVYEMELESGKNYYVSETNKVIKLLPQTPTDLTVENKIEVVIKQTSGNMLWGGVPLIFEGGVENVPIIEPNVIYVFTFTYNNLLSAWMVKTETYK